jgi:hypothetical protein
MIVFFTFQHKETPHQSTSWLWLSLIIVKLELGEKQIEWISESISAV